MQTFIFTLLKSVVKIFSASLRLWLVSLVSPSANTKTQLSIWDDKTIINKKNVILLHQSHQASNFLL